MIAYQPDRTGAIVNVVETAPNFANLMKSDTANIRAWIGARTTPSRPQASFN